MKRLSLELKILLFGKLAIIPYAIVIFAFLGQQYHGFWQSRLAFKEAVYIEKFSLLYRDMVLERGTAMLFLRGRSSVFAFKDVVKKTELVAEEINKIFSQNEITGSEKTKALILTSLEKLQGLREEIYTQNVTPEQAYDNYQNLLNQIHQSLSFRFDYYDEAKTASAANLLFLDVASLRDLLIQKAIVNMPLSTSDFNQLLMTASRPVMHESTLLAVAHPAVKNALNGWQEIDGHLSLKRKLDFMIKNADQGNFKIDAEEIYNESEIVLKKLEDVSQLSFKQLVTRLTEREEKRRMRFIYAFLGIVLATLGLVLAMRWLYRHTLYDHKLNLWRERQRFNSVRFGANQGLRSFVGKGGFEGLGQNEANLELMQEILKNTQSIVDGLMSLEKFPMRYKLAFYNKSLNQDFGQKELEEINFDHATEVDSVLTKIQKLIEIRQKKDGQPGKGFGKNAIEEENIGR